MYELIPHWIIKKQAKYFIVCYEKMFNPVLRIKKTLNSRCTSYITQKVLSFALSTNVNAPTKYKTGPARSKEKRVDPGAPNPDLYVLICLVNTTVCFYYSTRRHRKSLFGYSPSSKNSTLYKSKPLPTLQPCHIHMMYTCILFSYFDNVDRFTIESVKTTSI